MENRAKTVKNIKTMCIVLGIILLILAGRLFYIQVIGGSQLAEVAHQQSMIRLTGSNTRGIIYDRNGAALVADSRQYIYIIREDRFNGEAAGIMEELSADIVSEDNEDYLVYSSPKYRKNLGKKLINENQAYIVTASARYGKEQIAAHLLGYVNKQDSSGAAGLELMLDDDLNMLNRRIYAVADVKGNILPGRGVFITSKRQGDSSVKEGVRTTLDKDIQKAVEDIIEEEKKECAVVILDSRSGGVLTMASSPTFDPDRAEKYIKRGGDRLVNKATQGEYAPGSVFKIVVAAAALEEGVNMTQQYQCNGNVEKDGLTVACHTGGEEGHGFISFERAFAQSCNSFFIQLADTVGSESIIKTAEKMGLGGKILEGYPQESMGHVMTRGESNGAGICNLAIGQGESLVTPVQIAAMTNVIASGGVEKGVHILAEDKAGEEQVISGGTADEISRMMKLVTEEGTADFLEMTDEAGRALTSVKTGTAELGIDDESSSNAWITGFAPCEEPEFVITVLVEGGKSGSEAAGPIYKKILEYLRDSGSYSKPVLA